MAITAEELLSTVLTSAKKLPGQIVGGPVDITNILMGAVVGKKLEGLVKEPVGGSAQINKAFGLNPESSGAAEDLVSMVMNLVSPSGAAKSTAIIVPAILSKSFKDMRAADKLAEGSKAAAEHFAKTGVYAAPTDDIIRQVVSDKAARLKTDGGSNVTRRASLTPADKRGPEVTYSTSVTKPTELSNVLDHPELFDLMPDLKNVKVRGEFGGWRTAGYGRDSDTIYMGAMPSEKEYLSTLLHEVQHAVQYRSGMAAGGNPGMFFRDKETVKAALKRAEEMDTKASEALKKLAEEKKIPSYKIPELLKDTTEFRNTQTTKLAVQRLRELDSKAFQSYKNIAGEAEARAVERMFEERDYTAFPLSKYDVPLESLITDPSRAKKVEDDAIVRAIINTLVPPSTK